MRLLLLLIPSVLAFNPTTDIEIKYGGFCDNFLTFEECSDQATYTAVLANTNLKIHRTIGSTYNYNPDAKIQTYDLEIDPSKEAYTNHEGSRIFKSSEESNTYAPGCYLYKETSYNDKTYWSIHWRKMYDSNMLPLYEARKQYIEANVADPTMTRIYYAASCYQDYPCICRTSGGLTSADRTQTGTYHSLYSSGGEGGETGPTGPQGQDGTDGSDGSTGSTGPAGSQGPKGEDSGSSDDVDPLLITSLVVGGISFISVIALFVMKLSKRKPAAAGYSSVSSGVRNRRFEL